MAALRLVYGCLPLYSCAIDVADSWKLWNRLRMHESCSTKYCASWLARCRSMPSIYCSSILAMDQPSSFSFDCILSLFLCIPFHCLCRSCYSIISAAARLCCFVSFFYSCCLLFYSSGGFFFCCRRNFQLPIQFPVSFRSIRPLQHFHHTQLGLRHTLNHDVCARKYREQLRANRFEAKIHLAALAAKKFAKIVCSNSFRTVHEQWRNKLYCVYRA